MIPVSIYSYYQFWFNYRGLLHATEGITKLQLHTFLKDYIEFINDLNLPVTKSALGMKGVTELFNKLDKASKRKTEKDTIVDNPTLTKLTTALKAIDTTLDAELNIRTAYLPTEKRFSIECLMQDIWKLFSNWTYQKLPALAKFDFWESWKCLVFNLFTACAFHALRGTEEVLKFYYKEFTWNESQDKDTWWDYVRKIQESINKKTNKMDAPEELISNLDNLRKYYRNKTQHPQLKYSSDDAQDLLSACIKSVNMMMKDIHNANMRKLLDSFEF